MIFDRKPDVIALRRRVVHSGRMKGILQTYEFLDLVDVPTWGVPIHQREEITSDQLKDIMSHPSFSGTWQAGEQQVTDLQVDRLAPHQNQPVAISTVMRFLMPRSGWDQ